MPDTKRRGSRKKRAATPTTLVVLAERSKRCGKAEPREPRNKAARSPCLRIISSYVVVTTRPKDAVAVIGARRVDASGRCIRNDGGRVGVHRSRVAVDRSGSRI